MIQWGEKDVLTFFVSTLFKVRAFAKSLALDSISYMGFLATYIAATLDQAIR